MVELSEFAAVKTENAVVYHASNLDVLPLMADNSVDSIVCDPPYELGFMGKSWDSTGIAYSVELWQECLRVLKPGGHILAFGGSRTWHRVAVAIEDAGFELRDSIAWLYGSGFPKSHDISKGIDKAAGVERDVLDSYQRMGRSSGILGNEVEITRNITAPATDEAKQWQGWGTALKPAFEPVVVGRKPLIGTVAANVLVWGVGGLNIDASRINPGEFVQGGGNGKASKGFSWAGDGDDTITREKVEAHNLGRWPANIILDDFTAGLLDEQSGSVGGGFGKRGALNGGATQWGFKGENQIVGYGDSGGASRFFYVAKASKTDRNEGLEELPETNATEMTGRIEGSAGLLRVREDGSIGENPYAGKSGAAKNFHPTVKPTDLMRYLIKLVTPAGGVVLDPFTGSGSTGKAALLDGYRFIGIEMTADYLPIIEGRLLWAEAEAQRVAQAAAEEESIRLF